MSLSRNLIFGVAVCSALIGGCSTNPPSNPGDLCSVFQEKDSWYASAHRVHSKYGVPIDVATAIILQSQGLGIKESDAIDSIFTFGASEKGYLSVPDELWLQYVDEEGSFISDRSNFGDALDFVGWYMNKAHDKCGIALTDTYNQYLCYREGIDGYNNDSYSVKSWLIDEAKNAAKIAEEYRRQLLHCNLY